MIATPFRRLASLPPLLQVSLVGLLAVLVVACAQLWPSWQSNPDLSHGFFAPIVFALLLWESRRQGPANWTSTSRRVIVAQTAAVLGAVALFAFAGLLAASILWSHDLVNFALVASLCLFLFAGLLLLSNEAVRLVPLNWISLTAIFLWLLVAPLPHGTYMRLTLQLQASVTSGVIQTLHLFGVPARQMGNVIHLATSSVGVEEACSGIRSLLSCVYAGFFFAAWLVRSRAGRAVLIVSAPLLAIGMNFIRSLVLTLMVNAGVEIEGFWHDVTGFAILGLTAAFLALLATILESKPIPPSSDTAPALISRRAPLLSRLFVGGLGLLAILGIFFAAQLRPPTRNALPPPDLAALLPRESAGWEVRTSTELFRFSSTLRSENLAERTYGKMVDGQPFRLTVYLAYWAPAQVPVSFVATHTPDACWPGSGWAAVPVRPPAVPLALPDRRLPRGEYRQFSFAGSPPENVWFWHLYDGHAISYQDPYSVPALLKIALRYGFRREGEQVFVRVSSNVSWDRLAAEPLVQQIFANLQPLGL